MLSLDEIISMSEIGYNIRYNNIAPILIDHVRRIGGSRGLIYVGANTGQEMGLCKQLADKIYAFEAIGEDSVWKELVKYEDATTKQIKLIDDTIFAQPTEFYQIRFDNTDVAVRVKQ